MLLFIPAILFSCNLFSLNETLILLSTIFSISSWDTCSAKQILVSELVLAEQSNKDEMEELVDSKINNSFMLFRGNEGVKESVVKKFIPFNGTSDSTSDATQNG